MRLLLRFILISLILIHTIALSSCQNTVKGFGQDMENTGKDIKQSMNNN